MVINNYVEIEYEPWSQNIRLKQVLNAMTSYPNKFWKYRVVTYFFKNHSNKEIEQDFLQFLRHLLADLSARYIVTTTINAVKRSILKLNAEIIKSANPRFDFYPVDEKELKDKIKQEHRNTVRMILKILSYEVQEHLLPERWEIEHIFPQKWQSSYFHSSSEKEVKLLVEHIGNKIPFDKKMNIIASNGYFKKKQDIYKESKV